MQVTGSILSYGSQAIAFLALSLFAGCATVTTENNKQHAVPVPAWTAYHASSGSVCTWDALMQDVERADIVLIGEEHNDPVAHQLERDIIQAALINTPNLAVAMEMFERDEQVLVDFYLDDKISTETLIKTTDAKSWGGSEEKWREWYQQIVDVVKAYRATGARVIAANAPRRYATFARLEDEATLLELAQAQDCPVIVVPSSEVDDSDYYQRFASLMTGHHPAGPSGHAIDTEAYFRSQQLWDATMADAVLRAQAIHPKVILIAGDFHIASQGGLLKRILHANPGLDVMTISIERKGATSPFLPEDKARADIVIYTASNK